jgi:purine-nucleoside phosphorylase
MMRLQKSIFRSTGPSIANFTGSRPGATSKRGGAGGKVCRRYRLNGNQQVLKKNAHDEGLIRPTKRTAEPTVAPDAIMAMIPGDIMHLLERNPDGFGPACDQGFFKIHPFHEKGNNLLTLCGPFLGAPQAVMGMEKLIALGARRIWVLGWCGSIQPDLRVGDLLLPTDAVSEEGTSQHYPIGGKKAGSDQELTSILGKALAREGQSCRTGAVWTTDAPYRETASKVAEYSHKGILAVEMEMSALMTLSVYRSVRLAGLLVVSDELGDLKWRPGFRDPRFKAMSRFAAEFLFRLIERGVDSHSVIG